ncbi:lipid-A-disaccharide synthase [Candidatus Saganbacteria bacterium]|nr:lipid-A-disaccharide synthase [Candidatus Saganbacteria bacterium]
MKFFISACETSGDMHAAHLVEEIKKIAPLSTFLGIGSEHMRASGVNVLFDMSPRGTIGILETLPNLRSIYSFFSTAKELLLAERPDALILIDSQGFNVPLAQYAKKIGIKTIYYIAPQEWLWGSDKNLLKIAKSLDLIIAIFEKEYKIYDAAKANVLYFGHPLLDIVKPTYSREEAQNLFNPGKSPLICLCPGSRVQEIKNLFPILIKAAEIIKENIPEIKLIILVSSGWLKPQIEKILAKYKIKADLVEGYKYDVLNISDLALAASGTINLEASILGTQNIMIYKLNPLTYWIGKNILKIDKKMKYFSMPNILLDEKFIEEFVQDKAKPEAIAAASLNILKKKSKLYNNKLLRLLGQRPVISKAAQAILNFTAPI